MKTTYNRFSQFKSILISINVILALIVRMYLTSFPSKFILILEFTKSHKSIYHWRVYIQVLHSFTKTSPLSQTWYEWIWFGSFICYYIMLYFNIMWPARLFHTYNINKFVNKVAIFPCMVCIITILLLSCTNMFVSIEKTNNMLTCIEIRTERKMRDQIEMISP